MADVKKTGANTHRATRRGYAVDPNTGAGVLVEEGEFVPAGIPIAHEDDEDIENGWMQPVSKADARLGAAMEEALDPIQKDADLTQVGLPGLKAMAAERGINSKGLSEKDLIAAIKAKDDPLR